ncbi:malonyl CoA-ACP transacylase [Legionella steigerwaltii]|uniref:Malonyl CoA-acyl carrier protein transacylase n=1 Tax=Legionella steigerwaltii TaxID=460 RepID=A0A378L8W2_9GAMM|nr:ACP S-malonyltransferase [Legionella steigerwaltii]KTD79112.1 malonyl CoA-ACP transacylase [Legionella steigerwaltii]STY22780.1 malonyl CoA-ACP transacylase [Legionella steigerwaltii]
MTTYMFPGQGSQAKGMGIELFSYFPEQIKQADEALGYSIKELCLDDPKQQLGSTEYTQPALYVIEALSFLARAEEEPMPQYLVGHSLGEYAALFAAGVFDFITGLKLVQKRGALMAQASGGGMLAVINLTEDRIKFLLKANGLDSVDFANFNSTKQIVLSGPAGDIAKANELLANEALMCVPLKVSGAFHSRYMQSAADEFAQFIAPFQFLPLQSQVIANVTAEPYVDNMIKDNLVKQITHPVRWTETIRYLKDQGETVFIEVGPGNVLTRLIAQI